MKLKILTLLALAWASTVGAQTAEETGLAIAMEADSRDTGYIDSSANMKMTLRNRAGKESVRNVRVKTLEVTGDGDKSLSIFDEPADVKGTASLTWSHSNKPDEQWLYLPALKRVKRISSKNKSGPFMGSEFAFEDIGSQEVDKYTYKYLRDESIDGADTFVMERYPVDKNSGYTKQVVWIEKERYVALKIEFYDRKDSLLKTLTATDFTQYLDKHWRAAKLEMINHQSGKSTTLDFEDYQFKTGLKDADFNKNALKRLR
ncbi:MAG: outer membrane lipoprotein-sorting protein [Pseudomonadota bacterium]